MPGRGDNNKAGSAGRGASKQSNQGFGQADDGQEKTSAPGKESGGKPSVPQKKSNDQSANRNTSVEGGAK